MVVVTHSSYAGLVSQVLTHEDAENETESDVIVIGLSSTMVVPSVMMKLVKHHEWPGFAHPSQVSNSQEKSFGGKSWLRMQPSLFKSCYA